MSEQAAGTNGGGQAPAPEQQKQRALVPVTVRNGAMEPRSLPELIEFAKLVAYSSMVPKQFQGNVGDVIVAMQMGAELGLSPMAALQNIAVINGRPSLWGDAMLALVQSNPDCEDIVETFDDKAMAATCTVKRKGRTAVTRRFSQEDAKTAGLWGKQGPWTQYPKRMLQMRARGFAVRDACPDWLRGIITAEEAGDIVTVAPEWREANTSAGDVPGTVQFAGRGATPAQPAVETHDPQTGEVKPPEQKVEAAKPDATASQGEIKF